MQSKLNTYRSLLAHRLPEIASLIVFFSLLQLSMEAGHQS